MLPQVNAALDLPTINKCCGIQSNKYGNHKPPKHWERPPDNSALTGTLLYLLVANKPSKRMKYSAKFKLQVIKFADKSNNCVASRKFKVNEKLVREWRRNVEKIKNMPKDKCANRGRKCHWPVLEKSLLQWIMRKQKNDCIITRGLLMSQAKALARMRNIEDFTGSNGWCSRFMKRNNLDTDA